MTKSRIAFFLVLLFVFLLVPGGSLFAQSENGVQIIVVTNAESPALWMDSVESLLAARPELRRVHRQATLEAALEKAEADRIPLILHINNTIPESSIGQARSAWVLVDAYGGGPIADGSIEGVNPRPRDLMDFWWLPLVSAVQELAPSYEINTGSSFIRLEGSPGTVVRVQGYDAFSIPESGLLLVEEIPVPGTYSWTASASGAYVERGVFTATENGETLHIPTEPIRRFGVELGLLMGQFPDLALSWLFGDGTFFARIHVQQYLAGLYLGPIGGEQQIQPGDSVFLSLPLFMPGAEFGFYLNHPDDFLRGYLTAGAFVRIIPAEIWFVDPVAPVGITLSVGGEMTLSRNSAFFGELGGILYLSEHVDELEASQGYSTNTSNEGSIRGDGFLLELPTLRFGFRLRI